MHVYNLCRICLLESNAKSMKPLFDNQNNCIELVKKIEICGGIVLKPHDQFPKMICEQCIDSLDASYKFRSMCQASEHALLDAFVKSEMKLEPNVDGNSSTINAEHTDVFFGTRTEFIDAEVDITELTNSDNKSSFTHSNNTCNTPNMYEEEDAKSLPEFIDDSADSDFEVSNKVKPKRKARKSSRRTTVRLQNVSPLLEKSNQKGKKPGRPRNIKLEMQPSNIMCEICGNIYTKKSLLNLHMRRHMADKPFECEICGKTFACPSEISRHIRVHTGEKPFVCKYCGRTFADRSTNIKHERIHTNERPFTCTTCGKSFTYSNVLKNHMLTHTGEKPFPCITCNKTFSRKHQLDQHMSTITHQQTVKTFGERQLESDTIQTATIVAKVENILGL